MAAFAHFRSSLSCAPHNLLAFRLSSLNLEDQQKRRWGFCPCPSRGAVFASSTRKPRVRRKAKSNVDLSNEIREFVSAAGLPEGHVPSMKELMQHGRKDLANIVRRRGYKRISALLAEGNTDKERSLAEEQDGTNVGENESTGQDEKKNEIAEDACSLSKLLEKHFSSGNGIPPLNSGTEGCESIESLTTSSLREKATKFIHNGELDTVEVVDVQLQHGSYADYGIRSESGVEKGRGCIGIETKREVEPVDLNQENSEHKATTEHNAALKLNESKLNLKQVPSAAGNTSYRGDFSSVEGLNNVEFDKVLDVEAGDKDNQVEVNRLKVMLHEKELELSQLKERVEKEKLALSLLRRKAETEIDKAQRLISEKDTELHAAKEGFSGLKEVQIDYWGSGENVEVTGSFNGWHHRIKMDGNPSSNTVNPIGPRKSRLWSTVLWLYPGIYEIKFIVDGHWKIDPQKESVTKGTIQNNILRVDR